jgi:hypothetical protein
LPSEAFAGVTVIDTSTGATPGIKVRTALCVALPYVAEIVSGVEVVTPLVLTVNDPVVEPAAIVMLPGTVAAVLLLVRATTAPPIGATVASVTVPITLLPPITVLGESARLIWGAMPVPDKLTLWGLPDALSLSCSMPALEPKAVGRKVTLMVQLSPAGRLLPQLSVSVKSPLVLMLEMESGGLPLFQSLTVCAALGAPKL